MSVTRPSQSIDFAKHLDVFDTFELILTKLNYHQLNYNNPRQKS